MTFTVAFPYGCLPHFDHVPFFLPLAFHSLTPSQVLRVCSCGYHLNWVTESSRQPSLMWAGLIQFIGGLNRTQDKAGQNLLPDCKS